MSSPFISLVDLGAYLGRDLTDDYLGLMATDSACQLIRDFCGQDFDEVTDAVVTFNGGREILMLPQAPVTEVSDITEDDVALTTDDYTVDLETGLIYRLPIFNTFAYGIQNVVVTYTHGFTEVPESVRIIAVQIAARIYAAGITKSETIGSYAVTYQDGGASLNPIEERALFKYIVEPVG